MISLELWEKLKLLKTKTKHQIKDKNGKSRIVDYITCQVFEIITIWNDKTSGNFFCFACRVFCSSGAIRLDNRGNDPPLQNIKKHKITHCVQI